MCLCNLFWHICPPVPPILVFHPISWATLWPLHIIVINNPWIQLKCCQYMRWIRMRAPTGAWAIPKGKWYSLQLPTDKSSSSKGRRRWGPGVYSFDSSALCQHYAGRRSCWELTSTTRMLFLEVGAFHNPPLPHPPAVTLSPPPHPWCSLNFEWEEVYIDDSSHSWTLTATYIHMIQFNHIHTPVHPSTSLYGPRLHLPANVMSSASLLLLKKKPLSPVSADNL